MNMILKVMALMLLALPGAAQIRHVAGVKAVDVYFLRSNFGYGGGMSYVKYFSGSFYGKGSTFLEQGHDRGIYYRSIGVDCSVAKTVIHSGHGVYLNALGGCTFVVDGVTKGGEQFDIDSQFKVGMFGGLEGELFLTDGLVLIFNGAQRFLTQDAFGSYRWYVIMGVRFNL